MSRLEQMQRTIEIVLPPCVAVGTLVLCAYLYLTNQVVPDALAVSAAAANAYIFKRSV
jgi:hypothetical protein